MKELENVVLAHILENFIQEIDEVKESEDVQNNSNEAEIKINCKECNFYTDAEVSLKMHMQTNHSTARVHLKPVSHLKCEYCEYQGKYNIQMRKHTEKEHKDKLGSNTKKTVTEESNQKYKCKFCDYASDTIGQIWNHKLDKHTGQSFNFNNIDKVDKNKFLFNLLAEQNNKLG